MAHPKQNEYVRRYDEKNTTQVHLKLNLNTDKDILVMLDWVSKNGESKQGYIKRLIREDMKQYE